MLEIVDDQFLCALFVESKQRRRFKAKHCQRRHKTIGQTDCLALDSARYCGEYSSDNAEKSGDR